MPGQILPWRNSGIGVLTLLVTNNLFGISVLGPRVSSNNWKKWFCFSSARYDSVIRKR